MSEAAQGSKPAPQAAGQQAGQPSTPSGLLVRDLLSDLVAAVAAADAELDAQGEPFVIPRARVSAEFVLTVDRKKQTGFLLWANTSGSQQQARATVELELNAAPPPAEQASAEPGKPPDQAPLPEALTEAEVRELQGLLMEKAGPNLGAYMNEHDLRSGQQWNAYWQIAMLRLLKHLGWRRQRPSQPSRRVLEFVRGSG